MCHVLTRNGVIESCSRSEVSQGVCMCVKVYIGEQIKEACVGGGAGLTRQVGKPITFQKSLTMCVYLNQGSSYFSRLH